MCKPFAQMLIRVNRVLQGSIEQNFYVLSPDLIQPAHVTDWTSVGNAFVCTGDTHQREPALDCFSTCLPVMRAADAASHYLYINNE